MKRFGHLTNEEKGALMLAYHEGDTIEWARPDDGDEWLGYVDQPQWTYDIAYRIKPEEKYKVYGVKSNGYPEFIELKALEDALTIIDSHYNWSAESKLKTEYLRGLIK